MYLEIHGIHGIHIALLVMSCTATANTHTEPTDSDICGLESNINFRVIGGAGAGPCQFPWMVMIYNHLEGTFCGGSIIDHKHILTASHCCFHIDERSGAPRKAAASDLIVLSGSSHVPISGNTNARLVQRNVIDVIAHETYNHKTFENDIAILRLSKPITFDQCHRPLCLPRAGQPVHSATRCMTMGWGTTSNGPDAHTTNDLQYVDLPVVYDSVCRLVYGSRSSNRTFCAGSPGQDACQDDSGGPFICRRPDGQYYIYGIVSAGIEHHCGRFLGLYTKVPSYLQWIHAKTQERKPQTPRSKGQVIIE